MFSDSGSGGESVKFLCEVASLPMMPLASSILLPVASPLTLSPTSSGQLGHGDKKDKWAPVQIMRFRTNDSKFYDLRMPFL